MFKTCQPLKAQRKSYVYQPSLTTSGPGSLPLWCQNTAPNLVQTPHYKVSSNHNRVLSPTSLLAPLQWDLSPPTSSTTVLSTLFKGEMEDDHIRNYVGTSTYVVSSTTFYYPQYKMRKLRPRYTKWVAQVTQMVKWGWYWILSVSRVLIRINAYWLPHGSFPGWSM